MNDSFSPEHFTRLVDDALNPHSKTQKESEKALLVYKHDHNSLFLIDSILTKCTSKNTHFFALSILNENLKHRFYTFNEEMKNGLVMYIIRILKDNRFDYLKNKLNDGLVLILKFEYPFMFSTFIFDVVNESFNNFEFCCNAFELLSLFNFEMRENLPCFRKRLIVCNFRNEFFRVYDLVSSVLSREIFSKHSASEAVVQYNNVCIDKCLVALQGFLVFFSIENLIGCDLVEKVLTLVNSEFSTNALNVLLAIVEKRNEINANSDYCEECENERSKVKRDLDARKRGDFDLRKEDYLMNSPARFIQAVFCNKQGGLCSGPLVRGNAGTYHDQSKSLNPIRPGDQHSDTETGAKLASLQESSCIYCRYIGCSKNHFLLSPSINYMMLTQQDEVNLPLFNPKLILIHRTCLDFFRMYFSKFKEVEIGKQFPYFEAAEKEFVRVISRVLIEFYLSDLFFQECREDSCEGLNILIQIARIDDTNTVRNIVDSLHSVLQRIHRILREKGNISAVAFLEPFVQSAFELFIDICPRPEDVYVTQNEFGEAVKEIITDTDQLQYISVFQDCLKLCAELQTDYVTVSLSSKIMTISNMHKSWSHDYLNRICWSAGAISAHFRDNSFFTEALKHLLAMCENNSSKNDKAIIASNILFLVSSFDEFLNKNDKFLKTVIKKLFEFMQENHEGIMEMSCELFLKISKKTKIYALFEKGDSFLEIIFKMIKNEGRLLPLSLKRIVYQGVFQSIRKINGNKREIICKIIEIIEYDLKKELRQAEFFVKMQQNAVNDAPFLFHVANIEALSFILCDRKLITCFSSIIKSYTDLFSIIPECTAYDQYLKLHFSLYNLLVTQENHSANLLLSNLLDLFKKVAEFKDQRPEVYKYLFENVLVHTSAKKLPNYYELLTSISKSEENHSNSFNILQIGTNSLQITSHQIQNCFQNSTTGIIEAPQGVRDSSIDLFGQYIVEFIIDPSLTTIEYLKMLKSLLIHSKQFFTILFHSPKFNKLAETLLENLSNLTKTILISEIFMLMIKQSEKNNMFQFYSNYYEQIYENALALSLDKENNQSLENLTGLIKLLLDTDIPVSLNGMQSTNTNNLSYIKSFTQNLFKTNFSHINEEAVNIFIEGLIVLRNNHLVLRDHIIDFRFKVENMYLKSDINEEKKILEERIQLSNEIEQN